MFRRVAAHQVLVSKKVLSQAVVELDDGKVVNYYTFEDELPLTEWLGGTIKLVDTDGGLVAYWNGQRF